MIHVIALAHRVLSQARGGMISLGWKLERVRLTQEVALLRDELRIKDMRLSRIPAARRPYYAAWERMAILELRAARGWSIAETARRFLITADTIASWQKRIETEGSEAFITTATPVNRFPDYVRYAVQRLKSLCPTLGKVKIAEMLCRASLHLGATTVGRILKEKPTPERTTPPAKESKVDRVVTSKYPNHVWHVDLTVVPLTHGELWTSWFPFSLPQCWPFCWWVGVVLDHDSRRAMGVALFRRQPTSRQVRAFLGRTITDAQSAPKHLICDQGAQFDCGGFRNWCERRAIHVRYGAVGKHGSIAVIERFIRTLKDEGTRRFLLPLDGRSAKRELRFLLEWYNTHRPHMTLAGQTPNEVFCGDTPASQRPRLEPRTQWPRGSPCAKPQVLVAGKPGDGFHPDLSYHQNRNICRS